MMSIYNYAPVIFHINLIYIYTLRLLLFMGTNFSGFIYIDNRGIIAHINFNDFAITCSINLKMCKKF